jgi:iron complex outermembrane receptor protein
MNLDSRTTFDATLRYVGALPTPHLDSYCQLQASFDRQVTRQLDLSVSGFNLLRARHLEYPAPAGEYIRRSVVAQARWRFQ